MNRDLDNKINFEADPSSPENASEQNREVAQAAAEVGAMFLSFEQQAQVLEANTKNNPEVHHRLDEIRKRLMKKVKHWLPVLILAGALDTRPLEHGTFTDRGRAAEDLEKNGITTEQKEAYLPGVSELTFRAIQPITYESDEYVDASATERWLGEHIPNVHAIENIVPNILHGRRGPKVTTTDYAPDSEEDAWKMYLGMPQEHHTFRVSQFKPGESKDDRYYYALTNYQKQLVDQFVINKEENKTRDSKNAHKPENLTELAQYVLQPESGKPADRRIVSSVVDLLPGGVSYADAPAEWVMGHYVLSAGSDDRGSYISYYDTWNLEGSFEGQHGLLGKPFEIYDRIYYDPQTGEIVQSEKK